MGGYVEAGSGSGRGGIGSSAGVALGVADVALRGALGLAEDVALWGAVGVRAGFADCGASEVADEALEQPIADRESSAKRDKAGRIGLEGGFGSTPS